MTNTDFWTSIQHICANGFDSEGLAKLELYAELFITGKLVYQRFSPLEQHGCAEGGPIHVIASLLAAADIAADRVTAPFGSFQREQQCAKAQEDIIEQWAKVTGCWTEDVDLTLPTLLGEQVTEGGEAHVYYHGATLVKAIGLDYFVFPILALDRITLHNAYFPQTRMNVLGFGRTRGGDFQVIVEQPFIQGERMTDKAIRQYAEQLGFELKNARNWTFATKDVYLSDLHDENVICSRNGTVFVVDCDIRINTPELKAGGQRTLTNEVSFLSHQNR